MRKLLLPLLAAFGLAASMPAQQNPITTSQLNTTYFVKQVPGFYPTIQSAVTKACSAVGATVDIPAGTSPADTIGAVTGGCTTAKLVDERDTPATVYQWSGSAYVAVPSGGGSSLPTATAAGQIITSTAAGTTYATQGQVFYQQSTDTIASIETACSSLCTYIVSAPQTITLTANHTLSSNVQVSFLAGGLWTVNGSFTFTIPGGVTGTINRHFAGTSTIAFGVSQTSDYAEWFGAVADWNGTTGTNDTVPIQTALNAMTAGYGVTFLQPSVSYMISGAINIPDRGGLFAAHPGTDNFSYSQAIIVQTNASADIIRMVGTSGVFTGTQLGSLALQRSVLPTGTATGVYSEYNNAIVNNVNSGDSVRDFFLHGSRSFFSHCYSGWGFQGLHEVAGNYYGVYIDASDGIGSNDLIIANHTVNSDPAGTTGTYYGIYATGTNLQDMHFDTIGTNGGNFPISIIYTGTGTSGTAYDIHIINSVLDHFSQRGILIQGFPATGADSSVEIKGGTIATVPGTGVCVDIEGSSGVSVIGVTDISCQAVTTDDVYIHNSSNIIFSGNILDTIGATSARGIHLDNVTASSVVGNTIIGTTSSQAGILLDDSSSNNSITANSFGGTLHYGIYADTGTTNNTGFETSGYGGTITTTLNDLGSNPTTVSSLIAKNLTTGTSPVCPNGTGGALTTSGCTGSGGGVGGSGTTGYLPAFTASATIGNSHFDDGITHANAATLHDNALYVAPAASSGSSADVFLAPDGGDEWLFFGNGSGSNPGWFGVYDATIGVEPFAIKSTDSTHSFVVLDPNTVMGFTSAAETLPDTGISRDAAGVLDVGNGTKGSKTGTVNAAQFFTGTAGAAATAFNASQIYAQNSSGVQTASLTGSSGQILGNYFLPGTIYAPAGTALPTCSSAIKGALAVVGDATSPTYMGAYTSGGTITAAVLCSYNGTTYSWLTH